MQGYLGQVLSTKHGLKVLNLESKEARTHAAQRRAEKLSVTNKVQCVTLELSADDLPGTIKEIQCLLQGINLARKESGTDSQEGSSGIEKSVCPDEWYNLSDVQEIVDNSERQKQCNTDSSQNATECKCSKISSVHDECLSLNKGLCSMSVCKSKVCMIGLHCCGDLTPMMMQIFSEMSEVCVLVCVSCCYHRMENDTSTEEFNYFPLSAQAKNILVRNELLTNLEGHKCDDANLSPCKMQTSMVNDEFSLARDNVCLEHIGNDIANVRSKSSAKSSAVKCNSFSINRCALRLAAQETKTRWRSQSPDDHNFHMKTVAYRGILESLASDRGMIHL